MSKELKDGVSAVDSKRTSQFWNAEGCLDQLHMFIYPKEDVLGNHPNASSFGDNNDRIAVVQAVVVFDTDSGDTTRYDDVGITQKVLVNDLLKTDTIAAAGYVIKPGKAYLLASPTDEQMDWLVDWYNKYVSRDESGVITIGDAHALEEDAEEETQETADPMPILEKALDATVVDTTPVVATPARPVEAPGV